MHPERGVVEEDIFIPRDEYHLTRTLVLDEHVRSGTLQVELLDLGRGFGADPRRVSVRSSVSGVILWSWTQYGSSSYTLPPGEYSLEVADPPPKSWSAAWGDLRMDELLLWSGKVRVKPGEATRADIRW